MGVRAND